MFCKLKSNCAFEFWLGAVCQTDLLYSWRQVYLMCSLLLEISPHCLRYLPSPCPIIYIFKYIHFARTVAANLFTMLPSRVSLRQKFSRWRNVTKAAICGLEVNQKLHMQTFSPHISHIQHFKVKDELVIFWLLRRQLLFGLARKSV